jgi:hypothetical protein
MTAKIEIPFDMGNNSIRIRILSELWKTLVDYLFAAPYSLFLCKLKA